MTHQNEKHTRLFEEAAELGDRFPDTPEQELFEFMADVCGWSGHPGGIMGRAIVAAFADGEDAGHNYVDAVYPEASR